MTDTERQQLQPGDRVLVRSDSGEVSTFRVKYAPWQLGSGTWVVAFMGIAGGYLLSRVIAKAEGKVRAVIVRERLGWLSTMIRVVRTLAEDATKVCFAAATNDEAQEALDEILADLTDDPGATDWMLRECQALHDELLAALPPEPEPGEPSAGDGTELPY